MPGTVPPAQDFNSLAVKFEGDVPPTSGLDAAFAFAACPVAAAASLLRGERMGGRSTQGDP
jgi:hypothetical protein